MATSHSNSAKTNRPRTHCPECDGPLVVEGDETLCADCGLVVAVDRLDRGPEWTIFDPVEAIRAGAPLTPARHDHGLSTEIGFGTDGHGRQLPAAKRRTMHRLRRQHSRARWRSKGERNLAHGLGEVSRLAAALDLSWRVRDRAATIFREAHAAGLAHGRSLEGLAAASVYAACRDRGVLRTIDEVAAVTTATTADVRNDYGGLNVGIGLGVSPYSPRLYLERLLREFDVSDTVRRRAIDVLDRAEAAGLANGPHPAGLAAACLYTTDRGRLTQVELGEAVGVTSTTIRTRAREVAAIFV